jgi:pantetheine-phosphate adenylyltransferase
VQSLEERYQALPFTVSTLSLRVEKAKVTTTMQNNSLPTMVYPGSFDPITNGHIDIILRARKLFPSLVVAIYNDPNRSYFFPLEQRKALVVSALLEKNITNVTVDTFEGELLVAYCKRKGFTVIVRGLRVITDFEYEFLLDHSNQKLRPEVQTIFLMTNHDYSYISSSMVREVAQLYGDVSPFVPLCVKKAIENKLPQTVTV